jgi:hypothetical protein
LVTKAALGKGVKPELSECALMSEVAASKTKALSPEMAGMHPFPVD